MYKQVSITVGHHVTKPHTKLCKTCARLYDHFSLQYQTLRYQSRLLTAAKSYKLFYYRLISRYILLVTCCWKASPLNLCNCDTLTRLPSRYSTTLALGCALKVDVIRGTDAQRRVRDQLHLSHICYHLLRYSQRVKICSLIVKSANETFTNICRHDLPSRRQDTTLRLRVL